MTPTEEFINVLSALKTGDLGLLRTHAGKGLDESVDAFDLFAGLWWPLRQKNQKAPKREVAWLIAKLYAFCPIEHAPGRDLARQLRYCLSAAPNEQQRFVNQFDKLLTSPLANIEPLLHWALRQLAANDKTVDWVRLTDNLSIWERESIRLKWAEDFSGTTERG